ncbi:UTRA domain-containing protein [Sinosporangium album]|uniref:UTRA domain-containing protein n=1 Tax=Sinosporangium album TaxID=504805 RepID=UPI003B8387B6
MGAQLIREVGSAVPPPNVAAMLGLNPGTKAIVRRRTMVLDGKPAELTDSWYPISVADGTALAVPRKIKGGAVTLLQPRLHGQ